MDWARRVERGRTRGCWFGEICFWKVDCTACLERSLGVFDTCVVALFGSCWGLEGRRTRSGWFVGVRLGQVDGAARLERRLGILGTRILALFCIAWWMRWDMRLEADCWHGDSPNTWSKKGDVNFKGNCCPA